jgi:hypothetical protein
MDNPVKLETLGTINTRRRQTKQRHKTKTNKTKTQDEDKQNKDTRRRQTKQRHKTNKTKTQDEDKQNTNTTKCVLYTTIYAKQFFLHILQFFIYFKDIFYILCRRQSRRNTETKRRVARFVHMQNLP